LILDDVKLAESLWPRIEAMFGESFQVSFKDNTYTACGLNTRFRFSKYYKGTRFGKHCDASFASSATCESMFTVNIYLNDNSSGTRLFLRRNADDEEFVDVVPLAGKKIFTMFLCVFVSFFFYKKHKIVL
jgi:hypothetical protein